MFNIYDYYFHKLLSERRIQNAERKNDEFSIMLENARYDLEARKPSFVTQLSHFFRRVMRRSPRDSPQKIEAESVRDGFYELERIERENFSNPNEFLQSIKEFESRQKNKQEGHGQ